MLKKKRDYRSQDFSKKRRNIFYVKFGASVIVIILVSILVGYLSHLSFHRISNINIKDNRFIPTDSINNVIKDGINGSYLFLFPRDSIFLLPKRSLDRKLKDNFSSIKDIDIDITGLKSIDVSIKEYNPVATWCNDKCYLVDESGYIFILKPEGFNEKLITLYDFIDGESIGNTFISNNKFKELLDFIDGLKEFGININRVWKDSEFQTLVLESEGGILIHLDQDDNLNKSFSNLTEAIKQDGLNSVQLLNIEHINLRVNKQVIYKLR